MEDRLGVGEEDGALVRRDVHVDEMRRDFEVKDTDWEAGLEGDGAGRGDLGPEGGVQDAGELREVDGTTVHVKYLVITTIPAESR